MQTGALFLSLADSGGGNLSIYVKSLPAVLEGIGRLVCLKGCTKQCHICPKISCILGSQASKHPVISKLMHYFYLQQPPSHKCFDPWDVECLLSLLESWAWASSLTTYKLAWKTATLLALVNAKHCSDLTLLCIDNQHIFLQLHAAIFIPVSGGKTDKPGHLPPQIPIESHSSVNLCPIFI